MPGRSRMRKKTGVKLSAPVPAAAALCMRAKKDSSAITGIVSVSGLYSEKTGKTYDAVVLLDDTGGKYVNFRLEFLAKKGRGK